MRIAMVGAGYVGLVSGACFSEFGSEVVCTDRDGERLRRLVAGEMPIYEPGLEALVARNAAAGRLGFQADLGRAVAGADAVFIAVGTPSRRGDGHADLSHVFAAAADIARALRAGGGGWTVAVVKSTVPVGTARRLTAFLLQEAGEGACDVVSNPEFLREGSAIEDFMRPDRVVVGSESPRARAVMEALYRPLSLNGTPILHTGLETAETVKYATNGFLAAKIAFIDQIADLCEATGGDVREVARGLGLDGRIGARFLQPGPGYGGSCLPKDAAAFARTAREAGAPLTVLEAAMAANHARKRAMAARIVGAMGGARGRVVAVLGLAFKPDTDDVREAASLAIVPQLIAAGAEVRAYDPAAMDKPAWRGAGLTLCDDAYQAIQGAHALVIVTEWNEFRALDVARVKAAMARPLVVDLRNIYRADEMAAAGFEYHGIGLGGVGQTGGAGGPEQADRQAAP